MPRKRKTVVEVEQITMFKPAIFYPPPAQPMSYTPEYEELMRRDLRKMRLRQEALQHGPKGRVARWLLGEAPCL